jgi:hypothetical protein
MFFIFIFFLFSAALTQLALLDGGALGQRDSLLYILSAGDESGVEGASSAEPFPNSGATAAGASDSPSRSAREALRRRGFSSESSGALFSRFRHVVLVASPLDSYSPFESCLAQLSQQALDDAQSGAVYAEMTRQFYGIAGSNQSVSSEVARRFTKVSVDFLALTNSSRLSLDGITGRDAHIAFLESESFAAALAVALRRVF